MLDFVWISTRRKSSSRVEVYPKFLMGKTEDLMIRASDFYAFWDESKSLWSTDEDDLYIIIDRLITEAADAYQSAHPSEAVIPLYMKDSDSGSVDKWHKYCQKQRRDSYHNLDAKIIFANTETKKEDYASRKLSYPIEERETPAYEEVISTLYLPPERHKIEWAIGAIISGDSKKIQKFLAMYGEPGSGKGTIINIISQLFEGYCKSFEARILGLATAAFPLEAIKDNPLVAFDSDANLSGIEDNTRLNALISHEVMPVNTKNHSIYTTKFNTFVILGTNKPVRITDARSGIIRRLIDVRPSNQRIPEQKYEQLMKQIEFELGGIAYHCLEVYKEAPRYYSKYVPTDMISASNDFYNFVLDSYDVFKRDDSTTLKAAYEMYKVYCDDARVPYPYSQRVFKEELKTYFKSFEERATTEDANGVRPRNLYKGFIATKFMNVLDASDPVREEENSTDEKPEKPKTLELNCTVSLFDDIYKDCPAQYGLEDQNERPTYKWENVKTKLKDLDTSKLHYVKVPENLIVIDLDLKDSEGNKSFELNSEAAALFPPTYAELSKGGQGVHLHYIYNGDVDKLSRVYDDQIEVKVFTGNSSLRRRLSKCNDIPIAQISSGLPLKEDNKKVIDFEGFKNEKAIRTYVKRCLNKEYANSTRQSMSLLHDTLEKTYDSGVKYDISDMASAILTFAKRSTNSAQFCYELAGKLKLKSAEELSENFEKYDSDTLVFFDVETLPNLFLVVYKAQGKKCVPLINPTPRDIEELLKFKLIGFNCKKYDNHMIYARLLGESTSQLFHRSMALVDDSANAPPKPYIARAYSASFTDIWDYAVDKRGLKKWEIFLKIPHMEFGWPWNKPLPEDRWPEVVKYCMNDVEATEAVHMYLIEDFNARVILADIAGGTPNDSTNKLTAKFMFGNNKAPQSHFMYRNLAEPIYEIPDDMREFLTNNYPEMMAEPHGEAKSVLPYFPGYTFDITAKSKKERSKYRGYNVGEGGFVHAEPGMYSNVYSLDSASHHPNSMCSEYIFGDYTPRFYDILQARIEIKHKHFDAASKMFEGKLAPHLSPTSDTKALSTALKRVVNSAYGLTAQEERDNYISVFRDPRNVDNIVAKRGALFMVDLLEAIKGNGGHVIHCKTDSQKLVNPNKEMIEFVYKFAKRYGYTFEVEHHFEKICLVNNAVYIAKLAEDDEEWLGACAKAKAKGLPEPTRWTATGAQFQVPYVFKTLFSKEPIIFDDYCETKSVQRPSTMYIDANEGLSEGQHNYQFIGSVGEFTPVKPGYGGGPLVVKRGENKYDAVNGTKGYLWMESEIIRNMHLEHPEEIVDKRYYISLVDEAVKDISAFGDFEWFVG